MDYIFVRQNDMQFLRFFNILSPCDYIKNPASDNSKTPDHLMCTKTYYIKKLSMDKILVYYGKNINHHNLFSLDIDHVIFNTVPRKSMNNHSGVLWLYITNRHNY